MRRQLARFLGLCLLLAPAIAGGQPAAPDNVKRGRAEFDAGRESLKQGDLQGALAHFRTSLSLHGSPGTLLNLATVEEKLGLFASASDHYADALRLIPQNDERAPIARERIKAIEPRIPTLLIQFQSAPPPGLAVSLDGKDVPAAAAGSDIRADPGSHVLLLTAPGHQERRYDVMLQAGDRQTLKVPALPPISEPSAAPTTTAAPTITAAPTTTAAAQSTAPVVREQPSSSRSGLRTAGLTVLGIGGAAAVAGAITGGLSLSRKQQLDASCSGQIPHVCDPDLLPVASEGEALAHASTAAFVLAGVGVATGVTLLLISPSAASRPAAKVAVGPTGIVVQGRF